MNLLIPVDHGNSAIKTVSHEFPTGLIGQSADSRFADDVVTYNGQVYSLVKERNIPYTYDKSADDTFFVLTLFAIGKELVSRNVFVGIITVDLAVGLPPEHYSSLMEPFHDYFKKGNVTFSYNGVTYNIMIRNVFVYPQAYAAAITNEQAFMEKDSIFLVDIGGYTTDVLHLMKGDLDMAFCKSIPMGTITLVNDIATKFNSDYTIRESHIHSVLNGGDTILPDDVKRIIMSDVEAYSRQTIDKLRELRIDLRSDPAVFLGGGAIMLKKYLNEDKRIGKAYYIDDTKANAKGYEILARQDMIALAV